MLKVNVSEELCQGHTMCALAAPEVFTLRDSDGHAEVREPCVPEALRQSVRMAEATCPEQAIEVTD